MLFQGIKANLVKNFKKRYNVRTDREPMYHVTHKQRSRENDKFCAMSISRAIELCDVSRVVLHSHFISLTAACAVKTGFKVKGILYGTQQQPGQPFLINHLIGVLA